MVVSEPDLDAWATISGSSVSGLIKNERGGWINEIEGWISMLPAEVAGRINSLTGRIRHAGRRLPTPSLELRRMLR